MKKIQKIIETDEGTFHWCSHERDYRPIDMFRINIHGKYHFFCDDCQRKIADSVQHKAFDHHTPAMQILRNLGYDLDSSESVHQQFIRKHNL
jgi:hypothetical protein